MIRQCPNPNRHCKYFLAAPPVELRGQQEIGCFSDEHHEFHPESEYMTPVERTFRELGRFTVQMCRRQHDMEHRLEPPDKPPMEEMIEVVEREEVHLSRSVRKQIKEYHEQS